MGIITYSTDGDPVEKGVYACLTPLYSEDGREIGSLTEDKFFLWDGKDWFFRFSDQRYRGEVLGWIGPLQRKLRERAK